MHVFTEMLYVSSVGFPYSIT